MNVISFALYGTGAKYLVGALKNLELAAKFYPGWVCHFHVAPSVPDQVLESLWQASNIYVVDVAEYNPSKPVGPDNIPGMFTRFIPFDGSVHDRVISRDADSRICQREVDAVNQWIESGKLLHSCRDHVAHGREINGGMFGLLTKQAHIPFKSVLEWCAGRKRPIDYGDDQDFLCAEVWPRFKHSVMQHDSFSRSRFPGSVPFPTKRIHPRFMGEVWDENEIPRHHDWIQIPLET